MFTLSRLAGCRVPGAASRDLAGAMFTLRKLVTGPWTIIQPNCGCHAADIVDIFNGIPTSIIANAIFNNYSYFDSTSTKQAARKKAKQTAEVLISKLT